MTSVTTTLRAPTVLGDAGGNDADRTGTGDQHILADQVELERHMRGIAIGIEKGGELGRNLVRDRPQVGRRHRNVLGECTGAIDADAHGVRTQVLLAGAAVPAHAAHDVAFGGYALADVVAAH